MKKREVIEYLKADYRGKIAYKDIFRDKKGGILLLINDFLRPGSRGELLFFADHRSVTKLTAAGGCVKNFPSYI